MAPEAPAPERGANVRFPPPLLFLATIVAAVLVHHYVWALPLPLPRWAGLFVGGGGLAAGVGLMVVAHGPFKRTGQDPKPWMPSPVLIREGPYRLSRNPMYLAVTVMQIGLGFLLDTLWLLAALPLALAAVHFLVVLREEVYLESQFGEAYREYQRAVRRWI